MLFCFAAVLVARRFVQYLPVLARGGGGEGMGGGGAVDAGWAGGWAGGEGGGGGERWWSGREKGTVYRMAMAWGWSLLLMLPHSCTMY